MTLPEPTLTEHSRISLRAAMEGRDLAAIADAFAPDAAFHSPLTELFTFRGRAQIAPLLAVILEVFEDFHYTDELRDEYVGFLVARAKIGGQDIEIVDHMLFGADGRIRDFTVFFRPLPAAAMALRVIGASLGRQRSAARGALISALAQPLAMMARIGDGVGVRLLRPAA